MKKGLHPENYRPVVFQDSNDGTTFLTRSTVEAEETISLDGVEYPLVKIHISSASHPFFTGTEKLVDVEGRVDKFKARQEAARVAKEAKAATMPKVRKSQAKKAEQKLGAAKPAKNQTDQSVEDMIKEHIAKLGENIVVRRFSRLELGETV